MSQPKSDLDIVKDDPPKGLHVLGVGEGAGRGSNTFVNDSLYHDFSGEMWVSVTLAVVLEVVPSSIQNCRGKSPTKILSRAILVLEPIIAPSSCVYLMLVMTLYILTLQVRWG